MVRFLVVFFLSVSCAFANESSKLTAKQWLEKMSESMKTLNYQGTVAIVKNGRLDTMKYFHQIDNEQEKERLLSLNSPIRDVVRESGKVRCYFKESKTIVVNHRPSSKSFILNLPANFSSINDIYQVTLGKEEQVATLPVRIISIEPKDGYRYGRKIWVDKQNFLPLKIEVYGLSGALLEQATFTDLKVGQQSLLAHTGSEIENIKIKHLHQTESISTDSPGISLQNIPTGFEIVFFTQMNLEKPDQTVDHLLLSDGFSSVSVYKEVKTKNTQNGLHSFGAINSFTHVVKNYQITVMGEVPANTVQFVAQGVRFH